MVHQLSNSRLVIESPKAVSSLSCHVNREPNNSTSDEAWQEKLRNFQLELSEVRCVPTSSSPSHRQFKPKTSEDVLSAHFMSFSVKLAFAAALTDVNENTHQSFPSLRFVQNQILQLRDAGRHDEANELEQHLDNACQVKKKHITKVANCGGDTGSDATRETADGSGSLSARNSSSFFSSKPPPVDRSDRLDLAWMRQCYDEDEHPMDTSPAASQAFAECSRFANGISDPKATVSPNTRKYLKERRRQIKEIARKCSWNTYDVYNAHVVLDFLENRLPPRSKRTILDRLFGRKRMHAGEVSQAQSSS